MCKVCTEAVHCVALWTRVTLGLGMCKVCTEAVHCVSSPLQATFKVKPPSSPLQATFKVKPPSSPLQATFKVKPPSSPLQATFKVKPPSSPLEALLKPSSSPLQAPSKPPSALKASSPLETPLKPPWSPLQAPLKPLWSLPKVKPLSSLREGYLQRVLRWRWSPLRRWRVPFLKVAGTFLRTFEWTLRSVSCMLFFVSPVRLTRFHQNLDWLSCFRSNFPAFAHCDPCFRTFRLVLFDVMWYLMLSVLSSVDWMRLLSLVSRIQWLLCADSPFFSPERPSRLWRTLSRRVHLFSNLFDWFVLLVWPMIVNVCCFYERKLSFRVVVADWRANRRNTYPSSWQPKKWRIQFVLTFNKCFSSSQSRWAQSVQEEALMKSQRKASTPKMQVDMKESKETWDTPIRAKTKKWF